MAKARKKKRKIEPLDLQAKGLEQRVGIIGSLEENRKDNTWRTVRFNPPFCAKNIVVIPMAQTRNGPDTPGLRIRRVTRTSFQIRYDEVYYTRDLSNTVGPYGSNGVHPLFEKIGWVAYGF